MNRKHLVAIGVVIAVLLLLYWLFVAEDMNAWLECKLIFRDFRVELFGVKDVSSQKKHRLMKGLSYSFLRAICALVIGLVLVMFPDQAGDYFVITIRCHFPGAFACQHHRSTLHRARRCAAVSLSMGVAACCLACG